MWRILTRTVGTWAEEGKNSQARCKICHGQSFCFKKGGNVFLQQSATIKHKENPNRASNEKKQLNIMEAMKVVGAATEEEAELKDHMKIRT